MSGARFLKKIKNPAPGPGQNKKLQLHMNVQFLLRILPELFPVLAGRYTDDAGEGTEKVRIVIEAALIGDVVQGGRAQHLLSREHDPAVEHVIVNAAVGETREFVGQPRNADAERPGQVFHADRLGVVVIDVGEYLLDDAAAEDLALNRILLAHGTADHVQQIDHQGIIAETLIRITLAVLVFPDPVDAGDDRFRVPVGELVGADIAGQVLAEKVLRINLAAAQRAQDFRRQIEVSAFVILHLFGAGKPVHTERRKDEQLIWIERIEAVINAHVFPTANMNKEFKIVVAVELSNFKGFIKIMVGFVTMISGLPHGKERSMRHFSLYQFSHLLASGNSIKSVQY